MTLVALDDYRDRATGHEPPPGDTDDEDTPSHFQRGDQVELAEHVLAALGPDPVTFDAGEFWGYRPHLGIWERITRERVRTLAASFAGSPCSYGKQQKPLSISAAACVGAEHIARDRLLADPNRVAFSDADTSATPAPPGAVFRNGMIMVCDGAISLVPHAAEHRQRHRYDFDFAPWEPGQTPALNDFLDELFADCSEDERSARIALLQEFAGACLLGLAVDLQACLILYGEGANGKSSLLSLLRAMFPPGAIASSPPQKWSERFGLAALEGKRANFVDETPSAEILDGGVFKAVITGGTLTAERKNKDHFEFRPTAGHIFSTNWPITTTDHSAGFWRRPIILPFSRRFDLDPGRKVAPERPIIAAELGPLVAFAIAGAARAQRQGAYTTPDQSRAILGEWRDGSDQVRMFLQARESDDVGECVQASQFYAQYRQWATDNGHRNMCTSKMFGLRVMATGWYDRGREPRGRTYHRKVAPHVAGYASTA